MGAGLEHYAELVPAAMSAGALAIVALEWLGLTVAKKLQRHREGLVNVASAVLTFIPIFVLAKLLTLAVMMWLYTQRIFELGLDWWVWGLAYLAFDLSNFLIHWASHRCRLLWCVHSVHHSAQEMKASVAFRGSFADLLVTPHTTLWLPLLGFHPLMIVIVEGVGMMWGVLLHLSAHSFPRWRWAGAERLVISPALHRLHHARNAVYLDTNYGLTFSVWDRLARTLRALDPDHPPEYGLIEQIDSASLVVSQTEAWVSLWRDLRSTARWRDKLGYLFMPPGWRPGGWGRGSVG